VNILVDCVHRLGRLGVKKNRTQWGIPFTIVCDPTAGDTHLNRLKLYISKHLMAQERCTLDLPLKPTNPNRELQALFAVLPKIGDVVHFLSLGALLPVP
jgi:hypothetical protein